MPTTPNLALPYPAASDTADVPRDIQALAGRLDIVASGPAVSALPGAPVDGQECYFVADAAAGVVWHLRYRSAAGGSYKWEVVGGADLFAEVTADDPNIGSAYPQSDIGPTLTVPLAGDYLISIGTNVYNLATADQQIAMSYDIGATPAVDADAIVMQMFANGAAGRGNFARRRRKTIPAAATVLKARYKLSTAAGGHVFDRWISARPIRVG